MDNKENDTKVRMSLPYYMGFAAKNVISFFISLVETKQ